MPVTPATKDCVAAVLSSAGDAMTTCIDFPANPEYFFMSLVPKAKALNIAIKESEMKPGKKRQYILTSPLTMLGTCLR